MSVPNQTPYIIYNANGLTTVFPFEFYIISASDIQVSLNGTPVITGFTVSGVGNVSGGDITFLTPPANGTVVMLERVVPTYRLTDYQDNGDLLADTVNKDFDRLWMAIQRSFIYLGLALRRPLLGGPFDAEGYRISGLADPVNDQDAATKKYVQEVGQTNLNRALRVPEPFVKTLQPVELRRNKLFAWDNSGDPIGVLPESGSAADVMIELAKPTGASYIGIPHGGYLSDVLYYVTPYEFGGVGDGVADDTAAIMSAVATGDPLVLCGGKWRITSTIELPDGYSIDARSSHIIADTGSQPVFLFKGRNYGLHYVGDLVTGVASSFMYIEGDTDVPTTSNQYAKLVKLYGVNISSTTIETSLIMKKAVRQVFIDSCFFYSKNGIEAEGKTVEITICKSIIYGSTADTDSFGIKLSSTGGTKFYNEGWHVSDSTIDNFANTLDLADIFSFTVSKGYVACNATTAFAVTIRPPTTTTHTREIQLDGIFGGKIRFLDTVTGQTIFHTKISGEITNCKPGTCLSIGANAAGIDIRSLRVTSSTGCTLSSVANASANINYSDISTDSSLTTGIVFNGEEGSNCSISDYLYSGTGEALSLARAVKLSNVPAIGTNTLSWLAKYDYVTTSKDVAVGAYINQLQMTIARYSKIEININLSYSGGAASNAQAIGITVPTGVVLPNGANSMLFTLPATAGSLTMSIVATTTLDFKNLSFSIDNRAGNQLRILAGSHLSVSLAN
ncbi:phage tail fiber domain-containing protein [Citrobacter amalonaticus]